LTRKGFQIVALRSVRQG